MTPAPGEATAQAKHIVQNWLFQERCTKVPVTSLVAAIAAALQARGRPCDRAHSPDEWEQENAALRRERDEEKHWHREHTIQWGKQVVDLKAEVREHISKQERYYERALRAEAEVAALRAEIERLRRVVQSFTGREHTEELN